MQLSYLMMFALWFLVSHLAGFSSEAILDAVEPEVPCVAVAQSSIRQSLLEEINEVRQAHGASSLEFHSVLDELAAWRAAKVAAGGSVNGDRALLQEATQKLYRAGYKPHSWVQTVFSVEQAKSSFSIAEAKAINRSWFKELRDGDFLDAGIGIERDDDRCIYTFVFSLPKKSFEWRQVAPLRDLPKVRTTMLAEVNRVRRGKGLEALHGDPELDQAAQAHAEDMLARSYYAHRSPEGGTVRKRVSRAGYPRGGIVAENIAKGQFGPKEVVSRWMNSSGHRSNLLRKNIEAVGSGIAVGEDEEGVQVLWVQVFAGGQGGSRR